MTLIELNKMFDFIRYDFKRPFLMGNELVCVEHIFDVLNA